MQESKLIEPKCREIYLLIQKGPTFSNDVWGYFQFAFNSVFPTIIGGVRNEMEMRLGEIFFPGWLANGSGIGSIRQFTKNN